MSDNDPPMTFIFAPEIEDATISILWHEPERLPDFLRRFDPNLHLAQPHCRIILEAINLAYGELGTSDFATVTQVVSELHKLDHCGGIEGLNRIYSLVEDGTPHWKERGDKIFAHYLEMLIAYGTHRRLAPNENMYRFTAGRATVRRNKVKRPNEPFYIGSAFVRGRNYKIRGWETSEEEFSLTFEPL
jgi:hypothetical protein